MNQIVTAVLVFLGLGALLISGSKYIHEQEMQRLRDRVIVNWIKCAEQGGVSVHVQGSKEMFVCQYKVQASQ